MFPPRAFGAVTRACAALILCARASADTGRSGGILFQETFGARPFSLGQAYGALGDDAFGMIYNPAALSRMRESQAATQFTRSIADTRLGFGLFATPLSPRQALGLGFAYLDAGKAPIFDDNGRQTAEVSAQRDFLVQTAYAHSIDGWRGRWHLGGGAKVLRSTIADELKSTAFAGDAGLVYERPGPKGSAAFAVSAMNLGPGIGYTGGLATGARDPLPATVRAGLGLKRDVFDSDALSLGLQADRVIPDEADFFSMGVEYLYHGLAAARVGYRFGGDIGGLTMGVGLNIRSMSLDYAFGLVQTFNHVQKVSLNYRFTIPGIEYRKDRVVTASETLLANGRAAIKEGRFFDASSELARLETLFPGSFEATRLKEELAVAGDRLLLADSSGALYHYAFAFGRYRQGRLDEAVEALENAARLEPGNREIRGHLAALRAKRDAQAEQVKLEQTARIGTLFEIAHQAYDAGDLKRAERIVAEILKIGPYQPAVSLKAKIKTASRRPPKKLAAKRPAPKALPGRRAPTLRELARAEELYYLAVRLYAGDHPEKALETLREGLRLDPASESLRNTLERIEKELRQRR